MGLPLTPSGEEVLECTCTSSSQMDSIKRKGLPTGLHCTNYRAEVEALVHAANTIKDTAQPNSHVAFLTDANKSVLEAVSELQNLQDILHDIMCTKLVLQWIPSLRGIQGNEQAKRMARLGADKEQRENSIRLSELNIMIKSLFRTPRPVLLNLFPPNAPLQMQLALQRPPLPPISSLHSLLMPRSIQSYLLYMYNRLNYI